METKRWVIRFILGCVLGAGAGFVVVVLGLAMIALIFGGVDEYLNRKHPREEDWLHGLGFCAMLGAESATVIASFLGVMLAPCRYSDRLILRSWMMAATLGGIAGGAIGGLMSSLNPKYIDFHIVPIVVLAAGILAGIGAAIVLRLRVNC